MRSSYSVTKQAVISVHKSLSEPVRELHCHCVLEWSFSLEMEVNTGVSHSYEKQRLQCLPSANGVNKPKDKEVSANTSVFVNHAAIAWHESRRKWIGDQSRKPTTVSKDPIISWSTTYEELLSTNEFFSKPIPLPEMVDFLVDIWYDEGLFD